MKAKKTFVRVILALWLVALVTPVEADRATGGMPKIQQPTDGSGMPPIVPG